MHIDAWLKQFRFEAEDQSSIVYHNVLFGQLPFLILLLSVSNKPKPPEALNFNAGLQEPQATNTAHSTNFYTTQLISTSKYSCHPGVILLWLRIQNYKQIQIHPDTHKDRIHLREVH